MKCATPTVDPRIFFDGASVETARRLCNSCPLAEACRDGARETGERYGMYGGETGPERLGWMIRQEQDKETLSTLWYDLHRSSQEFSPRRLSAQLLADMTGLSKAEIVENTPFTDRTKKRGPQSKSEIQAQREREAATVLGLYQSGKKVREIAQETGFTERRVRDLLPSGTLDADGAVKRMTADMEQRALDLLAEGTPAPQVAEAVGTSPRTIYRMKAALRPSGTPEALKPSRDWEGVQLQVMDGLISSKKNAGRLRDVLRLTNEGKSKPEIAETLGCHVTDVGRCRRTLRDLAGFALRTQAATPSTAGVAA
jgi:DNA-binding NarL/FixJ family response regulator